MQYGINRQDAENTKIKTEKMDNKPYAELFQWTWQQLFIAMIIDVIIFLLLIWLQGPAPVGFPTNLIHDL